MKQRLEQLQYTNEAEHSETKYGEITVVENVNENRVQIIFPGKPDYEVRKMLKQNGFRWSPQNMAWQRHLNESGKYAAHRVAKQIMEGTGETT